MKSVGDIPASVDNGEFFLAHATIMVHPLKLYKNLKVQGKSKRRYWH